MPVLCDKPYTNETHETHFSRFPYPLSDFQKYAIEAIVQGDHVLVTAHTGSGKTLPAEFALQHFTEQSKKVIYTSPIKALSNQKYYEFQQKYPTISFGLFTGDIKTNPDAQVLIMTTEILMNTLFRLNKDESSVGLDFNIDINNDLGCVVFDEVHYINDKERGQVWEKTILMLPPHIQMVMLSATIDNPIGFAEWVESGRHNNNSIESTCLSKSVYLASTNKRVVPLSHYGYVTVNEGIFKNIKDKALEQQIREQTNVLISLQSESGDFKEPAVHKMKKLLEIFEGRQVFMKRQQVLNSLALFLRDREMLPAIAFVFSRKHVELCAKEITIPLLEDDSKVGYTVRRECEQIIRKLPNYQEYLTLPEYNQVVGLLEKGIGIHHSGMIPVLREIVELMISKKYIKLLFATESFAIGLDCPIKTAIFTSLTKYDGQMERYLMPHEYTQMAGRAGRRGLDTVGHVVHCNNLFKLPTLNDYRSILCGKPQQLVSKFRINYSLILNLLINGQSFDFMERSMIQGEMVSAKESFCSTIHELRARIDKKKESLLFMKTPYKICTRYLSLRNDVKTLVNKKRKECDREIMALQNQYLDLSKDIVYVEDYMNLSKELDEQNASLEYMNSFIQRQTISICRILTKRGFINIDSNGKYHLTDLGKIASSINEVHSLVMAQFMVSSDYFRDFDEYQLVGIFSAFTDIKLPDDQRRYSPNILKAPLNELLKLINTYEDDEINDDVKTGIKYDNIINYDMVELSIKWTECSDEESCRFYIQNDVADKGISVGDFNKAMMKIATISKELTKVAEEMGQIELLHKLSKIDGLVFKYVTTAQSLYL
uniref:Helicase n=1 Tax=viral metagenome TaxID=1070528 RepID=A0A6C0B8M3_9ZZZZ